MGFFKAFSKAIGALIGGGGLGSAIIAVLNLTGHPASATTSTIITTAAGVLGTIVAPKNKA